MASKDWRICSRDTSDSNKNLIELDKVLSKSSNSKSEIVFSAASFLFS